MKRQLDNIKYSFQNLPRASDLPSWTFLETATQGEIESAIFQLNIDLSSLRSRLALSLLPDREPNLESGKKMRYVKSIKDGQVIRLQEALKQMKKADGEAERQTAKYRHKMQLGLFKKIAKQTLNPQTYEQILQAVADEMSEFD